MDGDRRRACKARKGHPGGIREPSDQRCAGPAAPECAPVICEECLHRHECMEQRGQCTEYIARKEIQKQIEMLNKKYRTPAGTGTDKSEKSDAAGREKRAQPGY